MKKVKVKIVNTLSSLMAPLITMILGLFIIIAGSINLIIADNMDEIAIVLKYIALGMFILGGLEIIGCVIWLIVVWKRFLKNKNNLTK